MDLEDIADELVDKITDGPSALPPVVVAANQRCIELLKSELYDRLRGQGVELPKQSQRSKWNIGGAVVQFISAQGPSMRLHGFRASHIYVQNGATEKASDDFRRMLRHLEQKTNGEV